MCVMKGTPPTALLLCAQSEIEIVKTAIAQSSGVAKQAHVSTVRYCSRRPSSLLCCSAVLQPDNQMLD
jgi:hypothetical protein